MHRHKRNRLIAAIVVCALVGSGPLAPAQQLSPAAQQMPTIAQRHVPDWPGQRLVITLDNSPMQSLPHEVGNVIVGPDGRTWYERSCPGRDRSLTSIKAELTAEIDRPAPQLRDCRLQAIEPGGRVWLWVPAHNMLWGYDGKTWLEYVIPDFSHYCSGARCPTRGALSEGRSNVVAGGAVWFIGYGRVFRFDGRSWTRHKISDACTAYGTSPQALLAVTPEGKSAAACDPRGTLWLWRDGRWTPGEPLVLPHKDPAASPQGAAVQPVAPPGQVFPGMALPFAEEVVALLLPGRNDLWWLMRSGELRHRKLNGEKDAPKEKPDAEAQDLIDKLASSEYVQRERASERLAALGAAVRLQLEKTLAVSTDMEQRTRIKALLKHVTAAPAGNTLCEFGTLEVGDVRQLWQDTNGRVFIEAAAVVEPHRGSRPGLAVLNSDGKTQAVFFEDAAGPTSAQPWSMEKPPILDASTGRLLVSTGCPRFGIRLVDFQQQKFVGTVAAATVLAVDSEGRVFASMGTMPNRSPIHVFRGSETGH